LQVVGLNVHAVCLRQRGCGVSSTALVSEGPRFIPSTLSQTLNSNVVIYSVRLIGKDTTIRTDAYSPHMTNEEYAPSENEEEILNVLKEGQGSSQPWGRANPLFLREQTGLNKQQVNYALRQLIAAGWVTKVTEGLYEFVDDPRNGNT
jgi:hypothetical protein